MVNDTVLPPLYAAWMNSLLQGPIPEETQATCLNCAMCDSTGANHREQSLTFNPQAKCCTYVPELANFLVGRILADDDPLLMVGKASVEERIRIGLGRCTTPLGVFQHPTYSLLYKHAAVETPSAFGQSVSLRCPHYISEQGGLCGIWRHREAVCSTWFCKHVRGAVGMDFWIKGIKPLLSAVEMELAYWCVLQLELDSVPLQQVAEFIQQRSQRGGKLTAGELDQVADATAIAAAWGNWQGREVEFYCACANLVSRLAWHDVLDICGPRIKILARLAQEAYRRLMTTSVPSHLIPNTLLITPLNTQISSVVTYSPLDPLDLNSILLGLLPYFDGDETSIVLSRIAEEEGIELDEALLQKLTDFEILKTAT